MGARVLLVLLCMRISFAIVVVLRHIPKAFESFASMQYSLLVRNADLRKPVHLVSTSTSQPLAR
jgi:hypothetical protein